MATQPQLHVGFGKSSLFGTWKTANTLADDIDVRVIIAKQGQTAAAIAVADFGCLWPDTCNRLRNAIASTLNTNSDRVGIFTTQNHSTPVGDDAFNLEKIQNAFLSATKQAEQNLQPAELTSIATQPEIPLTFHRRVTLDNVGTFTFWFGFEVDQSGQPDCTNLLNSALALLTDGHPYQFRCPFSPGTNTDVCISEKLHLKVAKPQPLEPAHDPLVQGLFFRTPQGNPIGSILRIATHPAAANARGATYSSGDFPVYVRRRAEQIFGGTSLYLNGPCGNQASAINEKSVDTANKLGTKIANVALAELENAQWQTDPQLAATTQTANLTVRHDYPTSIDEARSQAEKLQAEIKSAAAENRPLTEIKQLSDKWEKLTYLAYGHHKNWTGLNLAGKAGQTIQHPIFTMKIGNAIITGLPGEPFGQYSTRIRNENPNLNIIVAEQGNGYLGYLPTKTDYNKGAYGPNSMIFTKDTEDILTQTVNKAILNIT